MPDRERGSVLLLFPAAVFIVLVLAAVAVDSSVVFLGQRELANAVTAAANDAATQALSNRAFYQGDRIEFDPAAVVQVAEQRVRASVDPSRHRGLSVQAEVLAPSGAGCTWTVRVRARASVDYVFARAVPGAPSTARVEARASSTPRQAAGGC